MKRVILIFIVVMILLMCGCESGLELSRESDSEDRFIQFYVDPETKVEYVLYHAGYAEGVCPRYNADGSLYVQGEEAND